MQIHNTVPYFLENYRPEVEFLEKYYAKFAPHFDEYFKYHCRQPELKKPAALEKYPERMASMKQISSKVEDRIHEIVRDYEARYPVKFDQQVHVLVGAFGSNAFTHKQIIPDITLCVEKLEADDAALGTIIAHEFGHALHNALSDQNGMDWTKLDWMSRYTTLLQEGTATYFSKQVVEAPEAMYFSFNSDGEEWLQFAKDHEAEIAELFLHDLEKLSGAEMFHEWFSINGGERFGHTRLAYYIGNRIVENRIARVGEIEAITLWKEADFKEQMHKEILALASTREMR